MIKLEYDVKSTGVRVSFVVYDGVHSNASQAESLDALCKQGRSELNGSIMVPQNRETLALIKALLDYMGETI